MQIPMTMSSPPLASKCRKGKRRKLAPQWISSPCCHHPRPPHPYPDPHHHHHSHHHHLELHALFREGKKRRYPGTHIQRRHQKRSSNPPNCPVGHSMPQNKEC